MQAPARVVGAEFGPPAYAEPVTAAVKASAASAVNPSTTSTGPGHEAASNGSHRLPSRPWLLSVGIVTTKAAGTGGRSAARRAAEAVARRAESIARRESQLLALATDFHLAAERAEKARAGAQAKAQRILDDAQAKADALREQAEKDAAHFDEQAGAAVRRMLALGESREAVADLTGWAPAKVREAQRAGDASPVGAVARKQT